MRLQTAEVKPGERAAIVMPSMVAKLVSLSVDGADVGGHVTVKFYRDNTEAECIGAVVLESIPALGCTRTATNINLILASRDVAGTLYFEAVFSSPNKAKFHFGFED